jgi:predicted small secreted protein
VKAIAILMVLTCGTLTACDHLSGVSRDATIAVADLPMDCVVEATKSVPGVTDVAYQTESDGQTLTLDGLKPSAVVHRVKYLYSGLHGNLYFRKDYKGATTFAHTYLGINQTPPSDEIELIRPAMEKIENSIALRCPTLATLAQARETCLDSACTK